MKANKYFKSMDTTDLQDWWRQYGAANQAAHYRQVPRRAARAELLRRGLTAPESLGRIERPKGYGPNGDEYLVMWGLGGRPRFVAEVDEFGAKVLESARTLKDTGGEVVSYCPHSDQWGWDTMFVPRDDWSPEETDEIVSVADRARDEFVRRYGN